MSEGIVNIPIAIGFSIFLTSTIEVTLVIIASIISISLY